METSTRTFGSFCLHVFSNKFVKSTEVNVLCLNFFFFFSLCCVKKRDCLVLIDLAVFLGQKPDLDGIVKLANHHPANQAIVISAGLLVGSYRFRCSEEFWLVNSRQRKLNVDTIKEVQRSLDRLLNN